MANIATFEPTLGSVTFSVRGNGAFGHDLDPWERTYCYRFDGWRGRGQRLALHREQTRTRSCSSRLPIREGGPYVSVGPSLSGIMLGDFAPHR